MTKGKDLAASLNAICPYFTMFPLGFPFGILSAHARRGQRILDPFCGRGTTNFAARLLGMQALGIDSSPVATAITKAKIVDTTADEIVREARLILGSTVEYEIPHGEFWRWAFHRAVLKDLGRLRAALLHDCKSDARSALRGIILGAIHGPIQKRFPSYFSNQCTRTYSPKPRYALNYWRSRKLIPEPVDVLEIINRRARRYYSSKLPKVAGEVRCGDSRTLPLFKGLGGRRRFDWVITSPPYYGMRTYLQDQWLRSWFLGGPDEVDYATTGQLEHSSPESYLDQIRKVWNNAAHVCRSNAKMVIRFGGIRDREIEPLDLIKLSLTKTGWRILTARQAGTALRGRRQAESFLADSSIPITEYDVWAQLL
jgi:SAM-dependent methyltransferase